MQMQTPTLAIVLLWIFSIPVQNSNASLSGSSKTSVGTLQFSFKPMESRSKTDRISSDISTVWFGTVNDYICRSSNAIPRDTGVIYCSRSALSASRCSSQSYEEDAIKSLESSLADLPKRKTLIRELFLTDKVVNGILDVWKAMSSLFMGHLDRRGVVSVLMDRISEAYADFRPNLWLEHSSLLQVLDNTFLEWQRQMMGFLKMDLEYSVKKDRVVEWREPKSQEDKEIENDLMIQDLLREMKEPARAVFTTDLPLHWDMFFMDAKDCRKNTVETLLLKALNCMLSIDLPNLLSRSQRLLIKEKLTREAFLSISDAFYRHLHKHLPSLVDHPILYGVEERFGVAAESEDIREQYQYLYSLSEKIGLTQTHILSFLYPLRVVSEADSLDMDSLGEVIEYYFNVIMNVGESRHGPGGLLYRCFMKSLHMLVGSTDKSIASGERWRLFRIHHRMIEDSQEMSEHLKKDIEDNANLIEEVVRKSRELLDVLFPLQSQ